MKTLNNLTKNNHFNRLKQLFLQSDEVCLASPFLMPDFSSLFIALPNLKLKKLSILTKIESYSPNQIRIVNSLISLRNNLMICSSKATLNIFINNYLHGKIYFFKKSQKFIAAIITSANFTNSGLAINHEWGVELLNPKLITNLYNEVFTNPSVKELTTNNLLMLKLKVDEFNDSRKQIRNHKIDLDLNDYLKYDEKFGCFDGKVNYWLKPIGVSGRPISNIAVKIEEKLGFSKIRPNGVKINDILIVYAVGLKKILSVFKSVSIPFEATNQEKKDDPDKIRWPWSIIANNITPDFSRSWWNNNLLITELVDDFTTKYPKIPLTNVGGKNINALNYGHDKIKLNKDFAEFIIERIQDIS